MDPLAVADLLDRLPALLPDTHRPGWAHYLLTVRHWRGVTLADRPFCSAILTLGRKAEAAWPGLVQGARDVWEPEDD